MSSPRERTGKKECHEAPGLRGLVAVAGQNRNFGAKTSAEDCLFKLGIRGGRKMAGVRNFGAGTHYLNRGK